MNKNSILKTFENYLEFPEEFPYVYFIHAYKIRYFNQTEVMLGMFGVLGPLDRIELWRKYLQDRAIYLRRSSYQSAHDQLKYYKHSLNGSIELISPPYSRRKIHDLTDKGINNLKRIFPDIYEYRISQQNCEINKQEE